MNLRTALCVLSLISLAACGWTDLPEYDVIAFAAEPTYNITSNGRVVAASCAVGHHPSNDEIANGLPRCRLDQVFAAQVANPADLTRPATAGRPAAAPVAAAARSYLYGGDAAIGSTAGTNQTGQVLLIPQPASAAP